jgi:hypothetical protein
MNDAERKVSEVWRTLRYALSMGVICFGFYMFYLCVKALAGEETALVFLASWFTGDAAPISISITANVCLSVWAFGERWFRQSKTEYLTARIRELEQILDAGRTSSGLPGTGQTHPDDR